MGLKNHEDGGAGTYSNILQDLTLVIPTYNRPQFLIRLLNYYASKNSQLQFLILDSSNEENRALNRQAVNGLGKHARYLDFSSSIPVATKLLEGLKQVQTSFCAFCADDDLVFVEGLAEAQSFLKDHPAYVCVDGIYLNFNPQGQDLHLVIEYATKGMNADDAGARVFRLFQKYESIFYGVFRTRDAVKIFTGVSKNPSLHYQELFQATSALLLGKSHRLPVFYAARQHCDPADMTRDKWQTYYWFADNPREFVDHYLAYREELWRFYQAHNPEKKYDQELFKRLMDVSHAMYFGIGCPPAYFHSALQPEAWPKDVFQKPGYLTNICNQLKSSRRFWLESKMEKFSEVLPKVVASIYRPGSLRRLDRAVQKKTSMQWKCKLNRKLRWLARVSEFQTAYLELCKYMSV